MDEDLPKHTKYWLKDANNDCFFIVGPESGPTERIGALKILLMGYSEAFRAMLQDSELAETGEICITDVEPITFYNLLKCVYGSTEIVIHKLTFEESAKLLYVAEKYLMDDIKAQVSSKICTLFSPDKIFLALSNSVCFHHESLQKDILKTLQCDFKKLTANEDFFKLSYDAIKWIVQQTHLNVMEIEVWDAVLKWAKHKTDSSDEKVHRSCIFPLLKYIRFLTMDSKDFWTKVVPSNILLKEEVYDIFQLLSTGNVPSIENYLCKNKNYRYYTPAASNKMKSSFTENSDYAVILCSVTNITSFVLDMKEFSQVFYWYGYLWGVCMRKSIDNSLAAYLYCHGHNETSHCSVTYKTSILNQRENPDEIQSFSRSFCYSTQNWGTDSLINWDSLLNVDNGFVKNNSITVMVRIRMESS